MRYWETEFEQLTPSKNRAGKRIYTNKDIKLILDIKTLLREKKYTIEGAKKILDDGGAIQSSPKKSNHKTEKKNIPTSQSKKNSVEVDLMEIRNFLVDLKSKL